MDTNEEMFESQSEITSGLCAFVTGAALGAAVATLLDAGQGRRRRAVLRDKARSLASRGIDAARKTGRDAANRGRGMYSATRSAVQSEKYAPDYTIVERVRSRLGRVVSHPRGIHVECANGKVTLYGPILADEVEPLLSAVQCVEGVREILSMLEPHDRPGDIPALQGGRPTRMRRAGWPPAARLAAGVAGAALVRFGGFQMTPAGIAGSGAGTLLAVRAIVNRGIAELLGLAGAPESSPVEQPKTKKKAKNVTFDRGEGIEPQVEGLVH